jgi:RNA polymerase sigma-70 factor (ECF subfamily)
LRRIVSGVGGTTPQSEEQNPALAPKSLDTQTELPAKLLDELWLAAEAASVDLGREEFRQVLHTVGMKHRFGVPPDADLSPSKQERFLRTLQIRDLALAQACALGRDRAWQQFLARFRDPLTQAAISITRSSSLGVDLADSLYADLFGLTERDGRRKSPLASYSGRGSLMGWLRTSLAQRFVDHHRRTHRESPLEDDAGFAVADSVPAPPPEQLATLSSSISAVLEELAAEDRFLLAAYFLDQQTLQQIAQVLHVHEATISRKLKRLTAHLRTRLVKKLQAGGMSQRAAEESLGTDPRDLSVNLRALLQTSSTPAFSLKEASTDSR